MYKIIPPTIAVLFLLLPQILFGASSAAKPGFLNERFTILALIKIHGAQATYQATIGNGNFGTFANLQQAGFIDAALASGTRFGYTFTMTNTPYSAGTPSRFVLTATPQRYRKTGKISFYLDETGRIRGADRNGGTATSSDPSINPPCSLNGGNESCALAAMRTLHGAEATFQATAGNGNFGSLAELSEMNLIDSALASGLAYGYVFTVVFVDTSPPHVPSSFKISAVPQNYPVSGIRSYFMATDGVLRGADKGGLPANENDPEIAYCPNGSIAANEVCAIQSLRTVHGAEATYQATYGNGAFGSLSQLSKVGLINSQLATGFGHGYALTLTFVNPSPNVPATFTISSVPQIYGTTGIRSFFIGTNGVVRAADKNGQPADENDPPINH